MQAKWRALDWWTETVCARRRDTDHEIPTREVDRRPKALADFGGVRNSRPAGSAKTTRARDPWVVRTRDRACALNHPYDGTARSGDERDHLATNVAKRLVTEWIATLTAGSFAFASPRASVGWDWKSGSIRART
jgi:hypothetical protein